MNLKSVRYNFTTLRKVQIKFIGPRSLLNKKINIEGDKSHVSKISSVSSLPYRPKLSQEEIEVINSGGISNIKDWTKIKLKKKV
jgi:hypothetical protein